MHSELECIWYEVVGACFGVLSWIILEILTKYMVNLSQDDRYSD
jgi:hypothetical protein